MSKIYDTAFRMGFLFNIVLFTILNIISFATAGDYANQDRQALRFAHYTGISWGFPFKMFRDNWFDRIDYVIVNIIIYMICGFLFGFLFKFIWSKNSSRQTN